jgi:hypothetical protein
MTAHRYAREQLQIILEKENISVSIDVRGGSLLSGDFPHAQSDEQEKASCQ